MDEVITDQPDVRKFRKKPVVIEAVQITQDNLHEVADWCLGTVLGKEVEDGVMQWWIAIATREGVMQADVGDWVIKGVEGEHYPCKPSIFDASYEPVDDNDV